RRQHPLVRGIKLLPDNWQRLQFSESHIADRRRETMYCHHARGCASRLLWICAILALTALAGMSQTLGQVTGRITDASGAAVAATTVSLRNTATNAVRNTLSTEDGDYTFPAVPPGIYNLRAERPGFRIAAANHLEVQVQQTVRQDL